MGAASSVPATSRSFGSLIALLPSSCGVGYDSISVALRNSAYSFSGRWLQQSMVTQVLAAVFKGLRANLPTAWPRLQQSWWCGQSSKAAGNPARTAAVIPGRLVLGCLALSGSPTHDLGSFGLSPVRGGGLSLDELPGSSLPCLLWLFGSL